MHITKEVIFSEAEIRKILEKHLSEEMNKSITLPTKLQGELKCDRPIITAEIAEE